MGFGLIQAADLSGWRRGEPSDEFAAFLGDSRAYSARHRWPSTRAQHAAPAASSGAPPVLEPAKAGRLAGLRGTYQQSKNARPPGNARSVHQADAAHGDPGCRASALGRRGRHGSGPATARCSRPGPDGRPDRQAEPGGGSLALAQARHAGPVSPRSAESNAGTLAAFGLIALGAIGAGIYALSGPSRGAADRRGGAGRGGAGVHRHVQGREPMSLLPGDGGVPAGAFMMGSPASERGDDDEGPQRQVAFAGRSRSVATR